MTFMDILFVPILSTLNFIISTYRFFLFIYIIVNLLQQFDVVNKHNQVVYFISNVLFRLYEPVLARIRVFLPNLGGIDISPIILIFGLFFLQSLIASILMRFPS